MKRATAAAILVALVAIAAAPPAARGESAPSALPIVLGPTAGPVERTAAGELSSFLSRMHPKQTFPVQDAPLSGGPAILLGTRASQPAFTAMLQDGDAKAPGSYVVRAVRPRRGPTLLLIAGADPRATLHAVYALLEERGCGFYLAFNRIPDRGNALFDPTGLDLADAPHVPDRIIFNWHNFLSSCSTWDLPDWEAWIRQAARMRYSGVMVHAYGNNPMVCFTHNGRTKPVGWLTTSAKGRDWGTQHVNDVRRLVGGDAFKNPVFGCKAALVPDDRRVASAKDLMKQVFTCAEAWGMDVVFALDVDTTSANPANIIETLPAGARFKDGRLPHPDTPEGHAYYKVQLDTLFTDYPQIDRLVVWFRTGRTPWRTLSAKDLPDAWRATYDETVRKTPALARDRNAPSMLAISRIVRTFRRILDAGGRRRVKLDIGTWHFGHMRAADAFMPRETAFLGLDYAIQFGTPPVRDIHKAVSANRPVIPIVWAHHDDRTYIGRPYTPFPEFASKLDACGASGFGIIHWTTRPLDLYFKSLSEQTWTRTRDLPLAETCTRAASRLFGPAQADPLGAYLNRWITGGPQFGRETSDRFIDQELRTDDVADDARVRLRTLDKIDAARLDPEGRDHLEYFKVLERFFVAFHEAHGALQESRKRLKAGDPAGARETIRTARPEEAIALYRDAAKRGAISRGEQAILISLNLRWLPYFNDVREAVGLRSVRVNFQPTQHDPLAQGAGRNTFFVDANGAMWRGLGARETGMEAFRTDGKEAAKDARREIAATGIRCAKPYTYASPLLPEGRYRVRLLMADPNVDATGRCVFDVAVKAEGGGGGEKGGLAWYAFEPVQARFVRLACRGNAENDWNSLFEIKPDAGDVITKAVEAQASGAVEGYPANHAIDGRPDTRWAAQGRDHWLQVRLEPAVSLRRLGIAWYGGTARKPRFEIQVSDDGKAWKPVKRIMVDAPAPVAAGVSRIDLFKDAGGRGALLERAIDVALSRTSRIRISLTPVTGPAVLCGIAIEPEGIAERKQAQSAPTGDRVVSPFSPDAIRAILKRVNAWQRNNPWKPTDRNWIRATWYTGVMAAHAATGDADYLAQARRWADKHRWQPGNERSGANILTCAQTYLELYALKKDRAFIEPVIRWLDTEKKNTPAGATVWYLEGGRRYADSLYVGAPPLAMLAEVTGDRKYLDWLNAFFWDVHAEIFDTADGLFYRDKRFIGAKSANGKKVFWSRGNGWAFASLPRILSHLPADDPGRARFAALFGQMAEALVRRQGPDGLWRASLDDPDAFPEPESSGTGFFCYGLAWGIRNGLLDRGRYLPAVKKAWTGLIGCVAPDGKVLWGQLVGDRPVSVKREHSHEYVTGTFLLAGSEVLRLVQAGLR